MVKFKIKNKGTITQGYNENLNPSYADAGNSGHSGVDYSFGWGTPITSDNTGYVYKTYQPQERKDNWTAVYLLVPHDNHYMEVCLGHLSSVWVSEGDTILEGQYIGKEGNFGTVYQGGLRITPEMQDAGDKRGAHVHESYRPVRVVPETIRGAHYLRNANGTKYRDSKGRYYEIIEKNGVRGHVDPMQYVHHDTVLEKLQCYANALKIIITKII